jgi:hypothetical protein
MCRDHDVERVAPNTQFFREQTQIKRFKSPKAEALSGLASSWCWTELKTEKESRVRTLQEYPVQLSKLLARLKKGEGLF